MCEECGPATLTTTDACTSEPARTQRSVFTQHSARSARCLCCWACSLLRSAAPVLLNIPSASRTPLARPPARRIAVTFAAKARSRTAARCYESTFLMGCTGCRRGGGTSTLKRNSALPVASAAVLGGRAGQNPSARERWWHG
jgi:hypothetical protein